MSETVGGSFVLRPGEGRTIDLGGFAMSVKATGEETGGAFSLLEADEPAGFGPPLHIHHDAAEAFYVLAGEYIIFLDGREVSCPAGSFIFIASGTPHGFRVGTMASRKLNLYTPAAMVGYFDELSDATSAGTSRRRSFPTSRSDTPWRCSGRSRRATRSREVFAAPCSLGNDTSQGIRRRESCFTESDPGGGGSRGDV